MGEIVSQTDRRTSCAANVWDESVARWMSVCRKSS